MISLQKMNTLAIPAAAAEVHHVTDVTVLAQLLTRFAERGIAPVILGGGSNVVLGERLTSPVCLIRTRGIRAQAQDGRVVVTAAAGENWHDLVRWSLAQGLGGLENLALIPGQVGAAPVQNIGAYGGELASSFVGLVAIELTTGRELRMGPEEVAFGYRSSIFKEHPGRFVITELSLALDPATGNHRRRMNTSYGDVAEELERMGRNARSQLLRPLDVAEAVIRIRRRKLPDPRQVPNAGSFFRNPVVTAERLAELQAEHGPLKSYPDPAGEKLAAAQLIERCMLAGAQRPGWAAGGPVRVWHRQPLVLTNPGRRAGKEVMAAAAAVQDAVFGRFAIRLRMEPDVIGLDPLL